MAQVVEFQDSVSDERRALQPQDFVDLPLRPIAGPCGVFASAVGADPNPPEEDPEPPQGGGSQTPPPTQNVSVRADVFKPGAATPFRTDSTSLLRPNVRAEVLGFAVPTSSGGQWRVRLTNTSTQRINLTSQVFFPAARRMEASRIAFRVMNHALQQFLLALGLRVRLDGRRATVTFGPDLTAALGRPAPTKSVELPDHLDFHDVNLATLKITAVGLGTRPGLRVFLEFETIGEREIEIDNPGPNIGGRIDIRNASIEILVALDRRRPLQHGKGELVPTFEVTLNLDTDLNARAKAELALAREDMDELLTKVQQGITDILNDSDVRGLVGRYLSDGLAQLGARNHVLHDLRLDGRTFVVRHFDPNLPSTAETDDRPTGDDAPGIPTGPHPDLNVPGPVSSPPGLERLERIETIVVLMQENRSFDHMLGHLRLAGRTDVDGLTGHERNEASGNRDVTVAALTDTFYPNSPDHRHSAVLAQIATGQMSGFLESYLGRYPTVPFEMPRFSPLAFHTARRLPTYSFLARNYLICNRWFSAFPGPTQPNRFCTLSGRTPSLENFDVDDPAIGFVNLPTIFDRLTEGGIEWVYYEQDVGFLRFYDRYRLDNRRVIPFDDREDGFAARARSQEGLPPVVFIDPDFVDVPPIARANDDHPPADIAHGQSMIAKVYDSLVTSPQWSKTLFLIVYDEHGGFYDHVPPPGTAVALQQDADAGRPPSRPPAVHPQGPRHLGVRIPALVISPWVPRRQTTDVVFDHTSIGRSILLRFLGERASRLTPRMARANNLGMVLSDTLRNDRPTISEPPGPPQDDPVPPGFDIPLLPPGDLPRPPPGVPSPAGSAPERDDFHFLVRRFGWPMLR